MPEVDKPATGTPTKAAKGFSAEERAAMRQRAKEQKAEVAKVDGERDVLEAIAAMQAHDRAMAERVHAIVKTTAPELASKTWYGMPAYALDGQIICFFQSGEKFKTRYATFGFSDKANLDDGGMWPNAYALFELTSEVEAKIAALVKKAVS